MIWTNYHTHSNLCDGSASLEEYIEQAIKKNIPSLGFSGHAPIPYKNEWTMTLEKLEEYFRSLKKLKRYYDDQIEIYTGLEVDFIPDLCGPSYFNRADLDFIIGSVHILGKYNEAEAWEIDYSDTKFKQGLELLFNNSIKGLVTKYYEHIAKMVLNDPPEIIGHLDLIKKFNVNNRYFDETDIWYKDLIYDTLSVISKSNCIVEMNTRGMYKGITNTLYPSSWIINECCKLKIPITLNADVHEPEELSKGYELAAKTIMEAGYREVFILKSRKWIPVGISINGLVLN